MGKELKEAIVGALVAEDRVEPLRRKRRAEPQPDALSAEDEAIIAFTDWCLTLSLEDKRTILPILKQLQAAEVKAETPSPIIVPEGSNAAD